MLELRHMRSRDVHQRPVDLHDIILNERLHREMIVLDTDMLEVPLGEDERPELLIDRLEKRLGRLPEQASSNCSIIATIAVDSDVVSHVTSASRAKSLDRKNIAFFHTLRGASLDEGDLLVAVDLVSEDIVTRQAPHGFDGNRLAVEFELVRFHDFLDLSADVIHSSIDTGFH